MVDDIKHRNSSGECAPPSYSPIINNNPIQEAIDKIVSAKDGIISTLNNTIIEKSSPFQSKAFDEAIRHLVPRELKPGDSLNARGSEKVSYEDLAMVSKDLENVSPNDAAFNKMPRIFVYPKPPQDNALIKAFVGVMQGGLNVNYFAYNFGKDAIIINEKAADTYTRNEILGMYAHEYGHRIDIASMGVPARNKFNSITAKNMENEPQAKNDRLFMQSVETTADAYASVAGRENPHPNNYSSSLISIFKSAPDTASKEISDYPSNKERIRAIEEIQQNPAEALKKLEARLAAIGCQNLSPADHNDIQPPSMPTPKSPDSKANKGMGTGLH